ncbi:MAG: haloalkane dehalogenase [Amylibacter sp.]|tara:strand:+ start:246 stop:1109 length:864 start_codon:yes stop_codon:yes gene_type:complete
MKYTKKFKEVRNKKMAYVDEGNGDTFLFLHGNPTSSYLWRNIAPHVEDLGRVVIPDLIGMGDSDKLDGVDNEGYKYHGQYTYLTELFDQLDLGNNIHLIIHDWGSAMGFQFARENPDRIKSITYMEAIVMPLTWEQWPDAATKIFGLFRSEAGEELVLEKNFFVERILLADSATGYTDEEKAEYIRPFINAGEDRRPTLTWPRQIPLDGEPSEVVEEVRKNSEFHKVSNIPKLFINADPGSILVGEQREFARTWKNQTEVTVSGNHFVQEDSSEEIGSALRSFVKAL